MRRLLLVVAAVAAADVACAATIVVDSALDQIATDGNCTLREAVIAANTDAAVDDCTAGSGADLIQVPAGTITLGVTGSGENAAATGDLDLTGTVTIAGDGAGSSIIEGNADDRMFEVRSGATVTLSGLSMRLSTPTQAGGVIHNRATLTVDGCAFESNTANTSTGGAIYSLASTTLTVTNTVFDSNSADTDGGAISSGATTTLTGVTFTGNIAAGKGGAIYISPSGSLSMEQSELASNEAAEDGGAIAHYGPATIRESTIRNNIVHTSDLGGAGIYCADPLDMERSLVAENTSENSGGGILIGGVSCVATLTNVTIFDNTADNHGGGIRLAGGGDVTLNNVTITDNSADDDMSGSGNGGGVDAASGGTVTLRNTVLGGNTDNGAASDCTGTLTSQGHNLLQSTSGCTMATTTGDLTGSAPALGALLDNGGPTRTLLPNLGSPLVDAGDAATPGSGGTSCALVDQRHYGRPAGVRCDIGAVERGAVFTTTTTTTTSTTSTSTTTTSTTSTTSTTVTTTTSTSTTSTTSTTLVSTTSTTVASTTSTTVVTTTTTIGSSSSTSTTTVPSSTSTTKPPPPPPTSTTLPPPPFCATGSSMGGVKLTLQKVGSPLGDEKMVFKGTLQVPADAPFDPATRGLQLLIEDVADGSSLLDLTVRTAPIAAGGGCGGADGWKKTAYRNATGAMPPDCAAGSAGGLRQLKMKDKRSSGAGILFRGQVKNGSMPAPDGSLRIAVVLGVPNGPCITHTFGPGACTAKGSTYRCK